MILLLTGFMGYAQQPMKAHVFAHNKGKQHGKIHVEIKWFTEKIEAGAGVYIYRQEGNAGGWLRVNDKPIMPLKKIDSLAKQKDEDLIFFEQLLQEKKPSQLDGITLLSVWIKAFESNDLAKFLGVYYNDSTVVEGKSYRYKIVQLISGAPKEIGITAAVKVQATEQFESPMQEIKLTPGKKRISFMWKDEPLRFWAVNVYRRVKGETEFIRVNKNPVMVNQSVDSLGKPVKPERMYEDDSLQENTLYEYQLSGVDFFGYETKRSTSYFCYVKDRTAPMRPKLKLDSVYHLNVYMSYIPVQDPDLKGYYIYRGTKSDGVYQRLTTEPFNKPTSTWVDSVDYPSPYYYFISAVDTAGNESASERIIANVEDVFEPEMPLGLIAKADTGRIQLSWKANTEKDLWGYYVYRGIGGSGMNTMVLLNKDPYLHTTYIDTINKAATNRFFYAVRAVDTSYNRSKYSDTVSAAMPDIIPPGKPFIKSVTAADDQQLRVIWIRNFEKDLSGYVIYLKDTVQRTIKRLNMELLPADPCEYVFTPAAAGPLILYIAAVDKTGNESERSTGFAYNYKPVLNDAARQELTLDYKKKNKSITFTWQYTGTNAFKGYVLYIRTDTEKEFRAMESLQQNNTFKITESASANGTYEVRLYFNDGTFIRSNQQHVQVK